MELKLRIIDEFVDCYKLSQMPEAVRKSVQNGLDQGHAVSFSATQAAAPTLGRRGGSLAMMELARLAADAGNRP